MSNFKYALLILSLILVACGSSYNATKVASKTANPAEISNNKHQWIYGVRYVGGRLVENGNGDIWVEQATVTTFIPTQPTHPPIVMVPGLGLNGSMYTTTTDGKRKGWAQVFAEAGYPVYVYDMPEYSTSGGFDVTLLSRVLDPLQSNIDHFGTALPAEGTACKTVDRGRRGPYEVCPQPLPTDFSTPSFSIYGSTNFRAWVGLENGEPWEGTKFPLDDYSIKQFEKSFPYRWNDNRIEGADVAPITGNVEAEALVYLYNEIGEPFIIMTHSMGSTVVPALLESRPEVLRAVVGYEPAGLVNSNSLAERAMQLKDKPYLSLYGDNVEERGHLGRYELNLQALVPAVSEVGGVSGAIYLPALGITGNSHMMAQDTNNIKIAELLIDWLNENVQ